jgi:predicted RNase H-like HicB family nuclease
MELAQRPSNGRAEERILPEGWPAFIRTKVFYGPEEDHWYAIDADFDIASQGASASEALVSLQRMLCAYLESYVNEGRDFDSTKRPIPTALRAKLHAKVALGRALRALHRGDNSMEEGDFLFPSFAGGC